MQQVTHVIGNISQSDSKLSQTLKLSTSNLNCPRCSTLLLGRFRCLLRRRPSQIVRVNCYRRPFVLRALHQLLDDLRSDANDILTLPVLDEAEGLKGADDVVRSDRRHLAETQILPLFVLQ